VTVSVTAGGQITLNGKAGVGTIVVVATTG
jgi:hypothetical protein